MKYKSIILGLIIFVLVACNNKSNKRLNAINTDTMSCESALPSRFLTTKDTSNISKSKTVSYEGMVQIPVGKFMMGASDNEGRSDEYPQHRVKISSFWMDATEVTNAQFKKFVDATGYITTA